MKEQVVGKLMLDHGIPLAIAEKIVDEAGNIDDGKLQVALASISWGRTPQASGDPRLVQALSKSYWEATDRRDITAMMSLKGAISKIGGVLMPRKAG